jgi:hypothetical protein
MKSKTLILNLALLAALPVAADEPFLRYNLSGGMHLNVEQESMSAVAARPSLRETFR